jgi:hypothetical protein
MMRTGFEGQLCACAVEKPADATIAIANRPNIKARRIITPWRLWPKSAFAQIVRLCWPQHGKVRVGLGSGDDEFTRDRV